MSLHPIKALDHVIDSYRDYLTTEFRARDPNLRQALQEALNRERFLAQDPFFSAHQPFKVGQTWSSLPLDSKLAIALQERAKGNPAYLHQSDTIAHLLGSEAGPLVLSTGTGSGKTEAFLGPVLQAAIEDSVKTEGKPGLVSIILYPMNALANDQEDRIRWFLKRSGWAGAISLAQYTRSTTSQQRVELRQTPPHILLTNYQMLEYLLVRPADREDLFKSHRMRFVVLDEVHTYGGTLGSHVAFLTRRLKAHLGQANPQQPTPIFVGASATIATNGREKAEMPESEGMIEPGDNASDIENPVSQIENFRDSAIQNFFGKLVDVEPASIRVVSEALETVTIPLDAQYAAAPYAPTKPQDLEDPAVLRWTVARLADLPDDTPLLEATRRCRLLWDLNRWLAEGAQSLFDLVDLVREGVPKRTEWDEGIVRREVELGLRVGAALAAIEGDSKIPGALRLRAHRFVRGGWEFYRCLNPICGTLYPRGESHCHECGEVTAPLYLCRNCGADFWRMIGPTDGEGELHPHPETPEFELDPGEGLTEWLLYQPQNWVDTGDFEDEAADDDVLMVDEEGNAYEVESGKRRKIKQFDGVWDAHTLTFWVKPEGQHQASLYNSRRKCPNCGSTTGRSKIISRVSLGTSAALKVLTEGLVEALPGDSSDKKRILIFADSRQDAAHQARFIDFAARYDRMRSRVVKILQDEGQLGINTLVERLGALGLQKQDNPYLFKTFSGYQVPKGKDERERYHAWEEAPLLDDLAVNTRYRASLENLGLLAVDYIGLEDFIKNYGSDLTAELGLIQPEQVGYVVNQLLDSFRKAGALSRQLLRYHPHGTRKEFVMQGANWERRINNPIGMPIDADGAPALRFEEDPPPGIRKQNIWAVKGRQTNPQHLITHLVESLQGQPPAPDTVRRLLETLALEQFIKQVDLYGFKGKPFQAYQVNADLIELSLITETTRFRCNTCSRVVHLPAWTQAGQQYPCPRCDNGQLIGFSDQVMAQSRYVQRALNPEAIPLTAAEHTAQVPGSRRKQIEEDFRSEEQALNVLACSPTLELGIHVGGLEAVALRNVPPRPDNYAQRGGRAGRDERVGLVVGYTRNTPHDQYFFQHPEEMIAGEVPAPAFSLGNRDALARHLYSIAFSLAQPGIAGRMSEYVSFKGEVKQDAVDELLTGLNEVKGEALAIAQKAFSADILAQAGYSADDLVTLLDELPNRVQNAFERTAKQVAQLHTAVETWSETGGATWTAQRAGRMINRLLGIPDGVKKDEESDVGSAYPLRRLAEAGLLPGYEFPIEPASLRLLGDQDEWSVISTARPSGLHQFQPGAPVYARGKRWKVIGVDKSSPWNPQGPEATRYFQRCQECELVFDPQEAPRCPRCHDANPGAQIPAVDYAGFIARPDDSAVSNEEDRVYGRNLIEIHPGWQPEATQPVAGRWELSDGWRLEWRRNEKVIWLNEGLTDEDGFRARYRLCPECGKVTNPPPKAPKTKRKTKGRKATVKKNQSDPYGHAANCSLKGQPVDNLALFAEAKIETLRLLFPWPSDLDNPEAEFELERWALTLGYALLAGTQRHYALAERDLDVLWEGFRQQKTPDDKELMQGVLTFIDPNIGGSGYLEKMAEEFNLVAAAALHHLDHDDCETACYRCLKHYTNQRYHNMLMWPLVTSTLAGLRDSEVVGMSLTPIDVADPRPWLEAFAAGCSSPLEHHCLNLLTEAGLDPVKQHPISDDAGRVFTVADFAFPEKCIVIYVDGVAYHTGKNLRRDRAIEARLRDVTPPWNVVRVGAKELYSSANDFVARVQALLSVQLVPELVQPGEGPRGRIPVIPPTSVVPLIVNLPSGSCSHIGLIKTLNDADALAGDWVRLLIRIPDHCFLLMSAIGYLCAWGQIQKQAGRSFEFIGNGDALNYLSRLDLFPHLDYPYLEQFQRHLELGRFVPLRLVQDDKSILEASNAICDLVLRNFDNGRAFLPALEWAIYEMIDNINLHAQTEVPGTVCAQFYPNKHLIDVAICDMGQGIRASLSESHSVESHEEAISTALQRGVTRNPNIGQGNGLAGALEIAQQNGGGFHLWTGDAVYSSTRSHHFQRLPAVPGTGILFRLDTQRPVDLGQTFIGESAYTYIEAESERIQEAGGIRIAEECINAGTRAAATPLRRKILALIPDYEGSLILDFEGVTSASSSFLDELLGRLAAELGEEVFRQRVKLVNVEESLVDMANVVIGQRLGE